MRGGKVRKEGAGDGGGGVAKGKEEGTKREQEDR